MRAATVRLDRGRDAWVLGSRHGVRELFVFGAIVRVIA